MEEERAFLLTMLDQMFQSPKSNTNVTLFTEVHNGRKIMPQDTSNFQSSHSNTDSNRNNNNKNKNDIFL